MLTLCEAPTSETRPDQNTGNYPQCICLTLFDKCAGYLRYHGRWIFKENAKNLFFAVQIEKTEKNNLQKEWRKKLFYFLR